MVDRPRPRLGPYGLLLASIVASVAVQGALPASDLQLVVVSLRLGTNLGLAFGGARASPRVLGLALLLATAGVVVNVLRASTGVVGEGDVRTMNGAVVVFGPPAIALGLVRSLR